MCVCVHTRARVNLNTYFRIEKKDLHLTVTGFTVPSGDGG